MCPADGLLPRARRRCRHRARGRHLRQCRGDDRGTRTLATAQRVSGKGRHGHCRGAQAQSEVAQKLGVSTATLRRRLADSDLSFRAIRARVLDETACALLAERRPVADVADALGFADSRSFSRAFKAWKGVTPTAFIAAIEQDPRPEEPIA
ncbi:helix-turn-helix domain-containing protein [Sphingomonas sp. 7/4-4]|uniref:helix-turn-helix domain-containing protein n=1 Tax=Sphingomonas sp. 7/4-4 TaxID=3018446 RepID=UPI003FA6DEFD